MSGILGAIGAFSNPYGTPAEEQWALNNASFTPFDGIFKGTPIEFYAADTKKENQGYRTALEQLQDSGGRRLAIYEYPYTDGQVISDLGRRGEKWVFQITFFGKNYRNRYNAFYTQVIKQNTSGTLTHPTRGNKPARLMDYEFVHGYEKFNAVVLRCTFVEDNSVQIKALSQSTINSPGAITSALRGALGALTTAQALIGSTISAVSALLLLPAAIKAGLLLRLSSITSAFSALLGQMASTFGSDSQLTSLGASPGGFLQATGGTLTSGSELPPVFQVGFTAAEQATFVAVAAAYTANNQISAQQLVFKTNQIRAMISEAIAYTESNCGCNASAIVDTYRSLAVTFQKAAEACIASSTQVVIYTLPYDMSLREVAFLNGLTVDRQNDISLLNPNLDSINFVPRGTVLSVPAA